MADLGIHGFPERPAGVSRVQHTHDVLDNLPEVFSTVWFSDHFQFRGEPWPEGWTRAVWTAAEFPRFKLGHMVLGQGYRNPGVLGLAAQTLQELSGGRLILGLGAGWLEEDYRAFGYDFPSPADRVAQLAEAIELIKTLWTESPANYEGRFYRLNGAVCARPDPPIPIMVGTNGPRALKVVARLADWHVWDGPWEPTYRIAYERLQQACDEVGRPFDDITRVCELAISLPADPAGFQATYENAGYPGQLFGIAGPAPADVIREIETLVDHGVSHVAINVDTLDELRLFIDEVVPNVRLEPR
jgi:alkanesulfonate monooxygenase SsuD/methylene tetrahydromethanopterin reductase-like flavin-dependent oxidoreductase (luciferase family)